MSDIYSDWTTSVVIRDAFQNKIDYRSSEYTQVWIELQQQYNRERICKWILHKHNIKHLRRILRTYHRTSKFRDELIYLPNIGHMYFECKKNYDLCSVSNK